MQNNLIMIQGLVDHIEENLSEDVNIVSLAKSLNLSPWHFQRVFKSLIGDTLGGYVRGRRLTRAAQLLLSSDFGILDIAFDVGFTSHEAFTRSFKSYYKVTPKSFKKDKPVVTLNRKPILTTDLYIHLTKYMVQEPFIDIRKAQTIVGVPTKIPSPFVADEQHCDLLFPTWIKLFDRQSEIANRIKNKHYSVSISPSGNFTEATVDYIAAVPVTKLSDIPEDLTSYTFPKQLVAIFDIAIIEKDTIDKTIDYIYGYWLPNSPYTRAKGEDYESFDNFSLDGDPLNKSQYILPLQLKE
ncbi:MAG: AraC family transcriptional regulator [Kangiella sp.]|nr:MAG: AraC family transcriptional regulator [Kangiella sp.]